MKLSPSNLCASGSGCYAHPLIACCSLLEIPFLLHSLSAFWFSFFFPQSIHRDGVAQESCQAEIQESPEPHTSVCLLRRMGGGIDNILGRRKFSGTVVDCCTSSQRNPLPVPPSPSHCLQPCKKQGDIRGHPTLSQFTSQVEGRKKAAKLRKIEACPFTKEDFLSFFMVEYQSHGCFVGKPGFFFFLLYNVEEGRKG